MTDKLEVAKLATQLTVALLTEKNGQFGSVVYEARTDAGQKKPEVVMVFDYLFEHIQARLSREN